MACATSGSASTSVRWESEAIVDINRGLYYSEVSTSDPSAVVSRRGEDRIRAGHPWIYRSDVASVNAEAGDVVRVMAPNRRPLGDALFSDRSQITLRMVSQGDTRFGDRGWRDRIAAAVADRRSVR